jgi:1-acyl-sn-glycerol-3-phosphate acyltransferase
LPFHGNLVQAALETQSPLVPVGLRYVDPDGEPSHAALYVGDTTFMQSLWRITGHPRLIVQVHALPQIAPEGLTRQEIARRARLAIAARLNLPLDDEIPESLRTARAA